jgi:O-antigen ligase
MTPLGRRIELGALIALALCLPLYEAPKTIAWLVYVVAWLANRARTRDFGGRWDLWDWLLTVWIGSGFVVAAFAGLHGSEWRGAMDLLRYGSALWLLKRSAYAGIEQRWLFRALLMSVAVGLAAAHWRLWSGRAEFLELNSVGHVNHTAIYIAIMLGACTAWLFAGGGMVAAALEALILVSLVMSESRGGIAVALAMLLALATAWWPRSSRPLAAMTAVVAVTVAVAWIGGAEVIQKHQQDVQAQNTLSYRDGIWRAALVAWERYPLCGIGMDNYKLVNVERLKAWRTAQGKEFDAQRYAEFPHAHSLYLNTLAERGVIGAVPLAAVLLTWLAWLLRYRPAAGAADDDWLWWGAAAAAWIVTTGVGLVNTTLHHEHGLLAAIFLGVWLSRATRRAG